MRRELAWLPTVLCFAACGSNSAPPSSGSSGTLNPNRLSPGQYIQSRLSIPETLDDSYILSLWNFFDLNTFAQYSRLTLPTEEIVVAVIDTGVDKDHEDLDGRLWVNNAEYGAARDNHVDDDGNGYADDYLGWDWVNHTNNPADDAGHGTHVAGTIAAIGGNGKGIVGIAPWVRIMALKVCDSGGRCLGSDIRAAIEYAVARRAKIINLSLGAGATPSETAAFEQTIADAAAAGTMVFVAAGNEGRDVMQVVPANATDAIVVSAYRDDRQPCGFTNVGWKVDLSAPGCAMGATGNDVAGILSLNSKKCGSTGDSYCLTKNIVSPGYARASGTSMATPHAAGLAAIAWTASPEATPLQIRQALLKTARATSAPKDFKLGAGRASATNLVDEARRAPGLKITVLGTKVGLRIEARGDDVRWSLKFLPSLGNGSIDPAQGTAFGGDGIVSARSSVNLVETFTPPQPGSYVLVLQASVGGRDYYDFAYLN